MKTKFYPLLFTLFAFACYACVSSSHHPVKSQTGSGKVFPINKKGKR